jgi:hypothetical protein
LEENVGIKFDSVINVFLFDVRFRLPLEPLATYFMYMFYEEEEFDLGDWEYVAEDVVVDISNNLDEDYLDYVDVDHRRKGWLISSLRTQGVMEFSSLLRDLFPEENSDEA